MKALLLSLLVLLTLCACKKENSETKVQAPSDDEIQAVDQEVNSGEAEVADETEAVEEEGTVMPEDEGIWLVNVEYAKKIAAEKNIKLLLFFTGSDWCGWCKRLHSEVLDDEEFQKELVKLFVPVKLDFPSRIKFPEAVKKAYDEEMKRYGIRGFPTLIIAEADGTPIAGCGYQAGGPEPYMSMLKTILEKRTELEAKVDELKNGGEEAAKELYDVLEEYASRFTQYPCVKDGLKKFYDICKEKNPEISRTLERSEKVRERLAELDKEYHLGEGENPAEVNPDTAEQAAADYKAVIDSFGLDGQAKQEVLMKIALLYSIIQEDDKAQTYVDEAVEADPESELAQIIKENRSAQEMETLMSSVNDMVKEGQKDEAFKAIEEMLAKTEDMNDKIMLTSMKAELQVLFNDIVGATETFQQCMDMCGNEEAKEQFQVRLNELDPFSVAVTQSQLFIIRDDPEGAVKAIDEAIEQYKPSGEALQKAYVMQAQAFMEAGAPEKIPEFLKKAVEVDPESEIGKAIKEDLQRMEQMRQAQERLLQQRPPQAEEEGSSESEKEE